jgi:nicotinate-nucleotide adenylyltransferase
VTGPVPINSRGDRRRRRIGLLGGSFNPAHAGHRHIALQALTLLGLDEVWLLVSPQNPLKPVAGMAPLADRLAGARALAGADRRLRATDLERGLGTTQTAQTLAALMRRFPRARFVWLMGADNLAGIHLWHRWTRIFAAVPVAILTRTPYSIKALGGQAARRFARFRLNRRCARGLADRNPPAWIFLHIRPHPASATSIRAATGPVARNGARS